MTEAEFADLANNNPKDAIKEVHAQIVAMQETLVEILAAINAPE